MSSIIMLATTELKNEENNLSHYFFKYAFIAILYQLLINFIFSKIFPAAHKFIFAQIFPAPKLMAKRNRIFIGFQNLIKTLSTYENVFNHVAFDLSGNISKTNPDSVLEEGFFEGVFICKEDQLYNRDNVYLICLGGNTAGYQVLIDEMLGIYKQHKGVVVIGFNPPGIGNSPGSIEDFNTYCNALKAVINNLSNNDIPFRKILVAGHSLGGGIAAKVVREYQVAGKNINAFIDRSMLSIGDVIGNRIRTSIPTSFLRNSLGFILFQMSKFMIKNSSLDLNVIDDVNKIHNINRGSVHVMSTNHDEMLKDCCLSQGLPNELHYFKRFTLKDDKYPKAHSIGRSELVEVDGEDTAEQFLNRVILNLK